MTSDQIVVPTTWYVYTYAFPDGTVFYVGKGCHARINDHEREAQSGCACQKCRIIRHIWESGKPVQKRIVYETLVEQEALAYEDILINDVYGLENLTNLKGRALHPPSQKRGEQAENLTNDLAPGERTVLSLRELREWVVLTQEELAQLINVSATAISHWETGVKQPRSKNIHKLAVALGVIEQDILSAIQRNGVE